MPGFMSDWKGDFSKQLNSIEKLLRLLQRQVVISSKRIEEIKVTMEQTEKTHSRAADRMADRMIEMAMVNQGRAMEAASHRRTLDEKSTEKADLWQDSPDTQWPPPGCDTVNIP